MEVLHTVLSQPCMDCTNVWHPLIMTLDHRDRALKSKDIQKMRTMDPEIFMAEINKCDVVCTNCHQIREYLRDMDSMPLTDFKAKVYKYYVRLVPYLTKGAMLRKDAFKLVPVGKLR